MTNMHLILAVFVGIAAYTVVLAMPSLKPAGIACAVLAAAYVVWREWGTR